MGLSLLQADLMPQGTARCVLRERIYASTFHYFRYGGMVPYQFIVQISHGIIIFLTFISALSCSSVNSVVAEE